MSTKKLDVNLPLILILRSELPEFGDGVSNGIGSSQGVQLDVTESTVAFSPPGGGNRLQ